MTSLRPRVSILLWLSLLLPAACSPQAKKQSGPPPAVPVTAATVARQDVPIHLKVIGSVEAYNTVLVRARVGGELIGVYFKEGQEVQRGDLLFRIDPRPFEASLQAALADSARDAARAVSAQATAERYADLVQKDYVTQQDFGDAKANAAAAKATVQADHAAIQSARVDLGYCSIRAPISGRTGSVFVRLGNLVKADDSNPLVVIQQVAPIYVSFSVPEDRLPEIRRYAAAGPLRVEVVSPGDSAAVHPGDLTFIDNAVDASTGTILLKGTFPNTDQALWPGQFVNVALVLTTRNDALVIPSRALQKGQQGTFVYLIKPDLAVAVQPVQVGIELDDEAVIDQGLQEGDRVVTDGQLRLIAGAKVDIRPGAELGAAARP